MSVVNRRDFLKLSGAALTAVVLKPTDPREWALPTPIGLGRVGESSENTALAIMIWG